MAITVKKRIGKNVFEKLSEQGNLGDDDAAADTEATVDAEAAAGGEAPETGSEVDTGEGIESSDVDPEGATDSPLPARGPWLRRVVASAACAVFLSAVAATLCVGWQLKQQHDTAAAGRAALAAAQKYAITLTSVDSKNIDQNFTEVLNGATGEFKDMYSQSASQFRQILIDNKAMSKGIVVDSAIKSASKTKVEVLLFIDQSISNVVNPELRIDRNRVALTMELIDNHWLASKVDIK